MGHVAGSPESDSLEEAVPVDWALNTDNDATRERGGGGRVYLRQIAFR